MGPVSRVQCAHPSASQREAENLDLDFTASKAESCKMWVVLVGNFLGRTGYPLFYSAGFFQSYKNGTHRWPSSNIGESRNKFKLTKDPKI